MNSPIPPNKGWPETFVSPRTIPVVVTVVPTFVFWAVEFTKGVIRLPLFIASTIEGDDPIAIEGVFGSTSHQVVTPFPANVAKFPL